MSRHIGHAMAHITVTDAIRLMSSLGGTAIQISLGSAGEKKISKIADDDARVVRKIRRKHDFYVVVHGKYLYNFCRTAAWQTSLLLKELEEAAKIGADVIIHQGKNLTELGLSKEEAHQVYADNISTILSKYDGDNKIIIENSSRQGTECGYALEDIQDIYTKIKPKFRNHVGVCIDLCHIFVAGELDVRNKTQVQDWFDRFDQNIGLENLSLIHFNDSNIAFNGANDNHAPICKGYIGNPEMYGNSAGMQYIAQLAARHQIPLILETGASCIEYELVLVSQWAQS